MTIYEENNYFDRQEYLESLASEYGIDVEIVYSFAEILGENEDFDGLVTTLEDYIDGLDDEEFDEGEGW